MAKYTDIDLYLTKNELTNDITYKYDVAAIAQSIKNIVLTTKGEKLFDSYFGGNMYNLLYNDFSLLEIELLVNQIEAALNRYETRAVIRNINIVNSNSGYWTAEISFSPVFNQGITKQINVTVGSNK
jgi:phage baseplate assembly protein W